MLPNANGAAVTILAAMSAGRVPAMINFTAGAANILAACKAAEIATIVTSRAFVEKAKLEPLAGALAETVRIVYLEDVRADDRHPRQAARPRSRSRSRSSRREPDDPAAILFTSGSEGTPKGVVLSHRNMLANAAQAAARIDFGRTDKVFNVLPVFHSFGLTVGLVLPLVSGVRDLSLSLAAALPDHPGARLRLERDDPVRHRHLPRRLRARGAPLRLPLAALHPRRRRAGQGGDAAGLHGEVRAAHPRGLRRHRDGAGARHQHADVQPLRHRRAAHARHGGAARAGARRRGRRPPLRARAERHARLSQGREPGRARAAGRGLARHRRHRHHRRRRASSPSRAAPSASPRSAARWSRSPPSRRWPPSCGPTRSRRSRRAPDAAQGRAPRPRHRAPRREPRRLPGLRQGARAPPS